MPSRETCMGYYTGPKESDYVACDNPVEPGEDFCEECGNIVDARFRNAWADIAQMEAPRAKREDIEAGIEQILGPSRVKGIKYSMTPLQRGRHIKKKQRPRAWIFEQCLKCGRPLDTWFDRLAHWFLCRHRSK